jgi:ABC-type dipeptide/oligopeptide/nickel transport system ATPase component
MSADQKVLSVKDLKTYIYVNNRCNKALDGVSFDLSWKDTLHCW